MKNGLWGRGCKKVRSNAESKNLQNAAIMTWLKQGVYAVNFELAPKQATMSHNTFWRKVRELMPPVK